MISSLRRPFPTLSPLPSPPSLLSPAPATAFPLSLPLPSAAAAGAVPSLSPASDYLTGEVFLRRSHRPRFPGGPALTSALPLSPLASPLEALAWEPTAALGASLTLLLGGLGASLALVGILSLVARLQPEGASFTPAFERLTSYECGFAPFGKLDQPQLFLFYKLAVFFVIFEAELIFLYPWALALVEASASGLFFLAATPFLLVLYLGFFYEIDREALDF